MRISIPSLFFLFTVYLSGLDFPNQCVLTGITCKSLLAGYAMKTTAGKESYKRRSKKLAFIVCVRGLGEKKVSGDGAVKISPAQEERIMWIVGTDEGTTNCLCLSLSRSLFISRSLSLSLSRSLSLSLSFCLSFIISFPFLFPYPAS